MLNQAQIIGHLGRDPEVRTTQGGDTIANFSVATTERWRDRASGEMREATEWHRITAYQKLAEVCGKFLRKGSKVFVQGKLVTRKWTDREGVERYVTEIRAQDMKMLDGKPDQPIGDQQQQAADKPAGGQGWGADLDDEIPF